MDELPDPIPPLSLPLERRKYLDRAWQLFVEDGVSPEGLPPEIARSWVRVRELLGVDPTLRRAVRALRPDALAERRRRDAVFRLAEPVLQHFAPRIESTQHVLAYFDAAGWMLSIQGDPDVIERVADINFAPGASWSEESVGTNGPGTAIREGKALEVFASEHFVEAWQRWSCAGAPIFGGSPDGPIGLVDITGPWEARSPHALALAAAVASKVEERIAAAHSVRSEVIRFAFRQARASTEAFLAVDADGRILAANAAAAARIGMPAGTLPADLRGLVDPLNAGASEEERVVEWRDLRLVSYPVLHDRCPVGAVIRALPAVPAQRVRPASRVRTTVRWRFERILCESAALQRAVRLARVAATNALPVVLTGESGTGKELLAQAIHGGGPRCGAAFVAVNCGAIPGTLLEAELFGYEAGAFTGGRPGGSPGKFEEADGGTLFLDEVSELSAQGQAALLRVLQEREVVRLGGSTARPVDVRVIAATNKELSAEAAAGRFRHDLMYRLDVLSIALPPLRQRVEDIPMLAEAFLADAGAEVGRTGLKLSDDAIVVLQAYTWPGNVRQLRNVILNAAATAPGLEIGAEDLPREVSAPPPVFEPAQRVKPRSPGAGQPLPPRRSAVEAPTVQRRRARDPAARDEERRALEALLVERSWNLARVAADLGISRMTLYKRLTRHGLRRPAR
jgi:transcriptional regulator of acetoin/glycerol metabolism